MTEADYVLVIASRRYRLVGDGFGPSDLHKGVQSEAALLRDLVYGDRDRWLPKVLPVVLDGHGLDEVPLFLQPNTASHYAVGALTVTDAADLLRVILRQPAHVPPPVAARRPVLPPLGSRAGWGALDALPAPVQGLLRAQDVMASELPYRLPGARRPSLATIYVRQELGSGTEAPQPEQPRTEPARGGKVPVSLPEPPTVRLVVRPPSRTIRAVLDDDDHLLVTGGPGQGKSTLSLRLAADIAEAWGVPPDDGAAPLTESVVPVRLTARDLAARLALPFAQALAESVQAEYGALPRAEVGAGLMGARVAGCRWLLLIDGLDEVADAGDRDRLVTVLAAWASDPAGSPYRILLTTRPIEGAALAPFQRAAAARYELQPFNEAALRNFAKSCSPTKDRTPHIGSSSRFAGQTSTSWCGCRCWPRSRPLSSPSTAIFRCRTMNMSCTRRTWRFSGRRARRKVASTRRCGPRCWSISVGSAWNRMPRSRPPPSAGTPSESYQSAGRRTGGMS